MCPDTGLEASAGEGQPGGKGAGGFATRVSPQAVPKFAEELGPGAHAEFHLQAPHHRREQGQGPPTLEGPFRGHRIGGFREGLPFGGDGIQRHHLAAPALQRLRAQVLVPLEILQGAEEKGSEPPLVLVGEREEPARQHLGEEALGEILGIRRTGPGPAQKAINRRPAGLAEAGQGILPSRCISRGGVPDDGPPRGREGCASIAGGHGHR